MASAVKRLIVKAIAAEREACAKIADSVVLTINRYPSPIPSADNGVRAAAKKISALIRERNIGMSTEEIDLDKPLEPQIINAWKIRLQEMVDAELKEMTDKIINGDPGKSSPLGVLSVKGRRRRNAKR